MPTQLYYGPLTSEDRERAYAARRAALDVLTDSRHLQSQYRPRIASASTIYSLLQQIWNSESEDVVFDDLISEEEINAMFSYVENNIIAEGYTDYYWTLFEYLHCDGCRYMTRGDEQCEHCESCATCCTCLMCEGCDTRMDADDRCSHCDHCETCCSCTECGECGERFSRGCTDCERCNECGCNCDEDSSLSHHTEGRPWVAAQMCERRRNPLMRMVGVEWEFNSCRDASDINSWAYKWRGGIHEDGSCGHEAVTPPLSGDYVFDCIEDLGAAFEEAEAKADDRCGLHVHVEARDMMWEDMFRLLGVYAHIEPVLFAIAGQNRQRNNFCSPAADVFRNALASIDRKGAVLALIYKDGCSRVSPEDARNRFRKKDLHGNRNSSIQKKSDGRYRSLNIVPWLARHRAGKDRVKDCTVEFRLHRNTLDADRVIGWALLCARIVDWTAKASDAEAQRVIKMTALHALAVIAPKSMPWIIGRLRDWRKATAYRRGVTRTVRFREGRWVCVG